MNQRRKSWATAAARRWKDPIVIELPDGEGGAVEFRVRGDLDGFAVMSSLTNIGQAWTQLKDLARPDIQLEEMTEEALAGMTGALEAMEHTQTMVRRYISEFLVADDRDRFAEVAPGVDLNMGFEIILWLRDELSPLDPTQPASSADGSSPDGPSLTGTVPSKESTPNDSRSTV